MTARDGEDDGDAGTLLCWCRIAGGGGSSSPAGPAKVRDTRSDKFSAYRPLQCVSLYNILYMIISCICLLAF